MFTTSNSVQLHLSNTIRQIKKQYKGISDAVAYKMAVNMIKNK